MYDQDDLIALRTESRVHKLIPGMNRYLILPDKIRMSSEYFVRANL